GQRARRAVSRCPPRRSSDLRRSAPEGSVGQAAAQPVAAAEEVLEQLRHARVVDRAALAVVEQVLLADVGDVGRVLVLSEQVVERLIAARAHLLGDGLVPFLAVGEDRVDVEHDAAEVEQLVAYDVADREARLRVSRSLDPPASLRRIELRPFHDVTRYGYTQGKARFRP